MYHPSKIQVSCATGGSGRGHNGIKSGAARPDYLALLDLYCSCTEPSRLTCATRRPAVTESLQTADYHRVRIGIGRPESRNPDDVAGCDLVQDFTFHCTCSLLSKHSLHSWSALHSLYTSAVVPHRCTSRVHSNHKRGPVYRRTVHSQ
jgi:hypothetical protein